MIENRQLQSQFLHNERLKHPERVSQPKGTHSQVIRYVDANGKWVLEAHRYQRPDGTVGASGRLDPKRLRIGNTIYIADKESI